MKKSERMAQYISTLGGEEASDLPKAYLGYFTCFNAGEYYEAHDVLEHLWLQGRTENYAFFKGLIQLAGAFVHLRKQALRPHHPKDGRRLRPAVRLFRLALANLEPYGREHLRLNVAGVCQLCRDWAGEIEGENFARNPWKFDERPRVELQR